MQVTSAWHYVTYGCFGVMKDVVSPNQSRRISPPMAILPPLSLESPFQEENKPGASATLVREPQVCFIFFDKHASRVTGNLDFTTTPLFLGTAPDVARSEPINHEESLPLRLPELRTSTRYHRVRFPTDRGFFIVARCDRSNVCSELIDARLLRCDR